MTRTGHPLYHYTCSHGAAGIGAAGFAEPGPAAVPGLGPVVWLTDNLNATRHDLGLTSHTFQCDRMDNVYKTLGPHPAVAWSSIRHKVDPEYCDALETGRDWSTWWISRTAIRVRRIAGALIDAPAVDKASYD